MRGLVENCRFDGCNLQDVRIWATSFRDVSFRGANLRESVLGGAYEGVRNTFVGIDFSEANLSGTIYEAAEFERCMFNNAKLVKIDFQTSTFTDCCFEGEINDVLFYRHGFKGEKYPPNEMVNVDFSQARLKHVGFRGLMLDRVRLPDDDEHIIIRNYSVALDRLIALLQQRDDMTSRKLVAYFGIKRKWAAPNQVQGVVNAEDLVEIAGIGGLTCVRELLRQLSQP